MNVISEDENGQATGFPGYCPYLRCGSVDDWWLHYWQWDWLLKHAEYQAVALLGEILFCAAVLARSMVQAVCR